MILTEIRVKLADLNDDRMMAYCSIVIDNVFVIRDIKIIDRPMGGLLVCMPSRKLTDRCGHCNGKNHLRARFCSNCGHQLDENRAPRGMDGRAKLFADVVHPVNAVCREAMQAGIIKEFHAERERARQPGYVCTYDGAGIDEPLDRTNKA